MLRLPASGSGRQRVCVTLSFSSTYCTSAWCQDNARDTSHPGEGPAPTGGHRGTRVCGDRTACAGLRSTLTVWSRGCVGAGRGCWGPKAGTHKPWEETFRVAGPVRTSQHPAAQRGVPGHAAPLSRCCRALCHLLGHGSLGRGRRKHLSCPSGSSFLCQRPPHLQGDQVSRWAPVHTPALLPVFTHASRSTGEPWSRCCHAVPRSQGGAKGLANASSPCALAQLWTRLSSALGSVAQRASCPAIGR